MDKENCQVQKFWLSNGEVQYGKAHLICLLLPYFRARNFQQRRNVPCEIFQKKVFYVFHVSSCQFLSVRYIVQENNHEKENENKMMKQKLFLLTPSAYLTRIFSRVSPLGNVEIFKFVSTTEIKVKA